MFPEGNVANGKTVFKDSGCIQCHRSKRDFISEKMIEAPVLNFNPDSDSREILNSILVPSHTISYGFGKGNPEDIQKSDMPELWDAMTVQELIDLISYLKSAGGNNDRR